MITANSKEEAIQQIIADSNLVFDAKKYFEKEIDKKLSKHKSNKLITFKLGSLSHYGFTTKEVNDIILKIFRRKKIKFDYAYNSIGTELNIRIKN